MRKKVVIIKNINYFIPVFEQHYNHNEDIIYFETETGLSIPGFTVMMINK
jgi:hypothetical protein